MSKLEDAVPSYEESIRDNFTGQMSTLNPSISRGSLSSRLAEEQKRRVTALVEDYIDPLLDELPGTGLSKTVLILIPSDIKTLQNDNEPSKADMISSDSGADEEIVGFSDDEYLRLVRLHGQSNSSMFWQQTSVMKDLGHMVRLRLGIDPEDFKSPPAQPQELPQRPDKKTRSFGFLKSKSVGNVPMFNAPSKGETSRSDVGAANVQAKVAREEVSVRSSTPVGLYETQSAHALVIRIRIG